MAYQFGRTETLRSAGPHSATVIFLHGLGDSGSGIAPIGQALTGGAGSELSHMKFVFPTAPVRPVTMNGGMRMPGIIECINSGLCSDSCVLKNVPGCVECIAAWFDLDFNKSTGFVDHEGIQSSMDYLGERHVQIRILNDLM
jgi:hypothetical protein